MTDDKILRFKKDIVAIGRLLWEKELVAGLSGNISVRVDQQHILLTATKTCLGLLQETDVLLMNFQDGRVIDEGEVSSERPLHTEIYKHFPDALAVVHSHTTFTNAYFLENDRLDPRIFESRFYLGEVTAIPQYSPSVTDPIAVVEALKNNNVVVLKNHGVVAMGKDLFSCFLLIQCLEEAVKIDAISRLYRQASAAPAAPEVIRMQTPSAGQPAKKAYALFSQEQIDEIVRIVNQDAQMQDLGKKTAMNMDLAVKLNESGTVYKFHFEEGRIARVSTEDDAEFLISAPEAIWRAVFNREIDPFVATTQKKMALRGDFGRISKWYAPCSRIFELWQQVPVA